MFWVVCVRSRVLVLNAVHPWSDLMCVAGLFLFGLLCFVRENCMTRADRYYDGSLQVLWANDSTASSVHGQVLGCEPIENRRT